MKDLPNDAVAMPFWQRVFKKPPPAPALKSPEVQHSILEDEFKQMGMNLRFIEIDNKSIGK